MKYYSTRDLTRAHGYSLREAAMMGLAPDGGLFVPERIPQVDMTEVERLCTESYAALAGYLTGLFFGEEMAPRDLQPALDALYDFPVPLRMTGRGRYTLELFHGPTCAFKDFGAGFMGLALGRLSGGTRLTILTATSGDTGSAVAHGFYGVPGIDVVILYPDHRISRLQERQMTTLGGNIHAVRVAGSFDDCQRMVKEAFSDEAFRHRCSVTSANSINLLRWIPQTFYYFWGYCAWRRATGGDLPEIIVPSGNYGNLSAGMLARRMGLPVRRFVAASNANDVIPEFLRTGTYRSRPSVRTLASAMDVGAPSNFERMVWMSGGKSALRDELEGFRCDDARIRRSIDSLYEGCGYRSDPHSAVGYAAAVARNSPGFYLSTAHPAKFGEVLESVTGSRVPLPEQLSALADKPSHACRLAPDLRALESFIESL